MGWDDLLHRPCEEHYVFLDDDEVFEDCDECGDDGDQPDPYCYKCDGTGRVERVPLTRGDLE